MTAPSPDAPGQGEAGVGEEVEDALGRDVVDVIAAAICHTAHGMEAGSWCVNCHSKADHVWAPVLLEQIAAHDASVVAAARADAEARLAAALRECDFAEEHRRHVANDEILVEVGLIRAVLDAAAPQGDT